ncbi:MAG TPA: hypothetical protein ENI56_01065 [Candidatus Kaiserbacteria bacterium]|nr:hypothetical protein [Candidatus Kaiserbacteria bacterium]
MKNVLFYRQLPYFFFIIVTIIAGLLWMGNPMSAHAQSYGAAIATMHIILNGNPQPGDIVSFDKNTKTFHLAHIPGDKNAFGVVVKNPVLLLSDNGPGFPIITSGEVMVNVTTKNGPIKAGDYISPSSVPGKGVKATISDPYIIGTAISSFPNASSTVLLQTNKIYKGFVQMLFYRRINPLVAVVQQTPQSVEIGKNIIFHIVKYILAALVAVGTVYVAFKASGSSMRSGIISIGRNPLAKSSIHSMLVLNTIMIILISAVGLTAALALVFLPV